MTVEAYGEFIPTTRGFNMWGMTKFDYQAFYVEVCIERACLYQPLARLKNPIAAININSKRETKALRPPYLN